ncbi:hypothetical protein K438DRAFT_2017765 [Mycena galopus ATCC 62051]|nr:hypothetical protein K438DRAFT_2017765 [Mycena galopus ATCC 62051]
MRPWNASFFILHCLYAAVERTTAANDDVGAENVARRATLAQALSCPSTAPDGAGLIVTQPDGDILGCGYGDELACLYAVANGSLVSQLAPAGGQCPPLLFGVIPSTTLSSTPIPESSPTPTSVGSGVTSGSGSGDQASISHASSTGLPSQIQNSSSPETTKTGSHSPGQSTTFQSISVGPASSSQMSSTAPESSIMLTSTRSASLPTTSDSVARTGVSARTAAGIGVKHLPRRLMGSIPPELVDLPNQKHRSRLPCPRKHFGLLLGTDNRHPRHCSQLQPCRSSFWHGSFFFFPAITALNSSDKWRSG